MEQVERPNEQQPKQWSEIGWCLAHTVTMVNANLKSVPFLSVIQIDPNQNVFVFLWHVLQLESRLLL